MTERTRNQRSQNLSLHVLAVRRSLEDELTMDVTETNTNIVLNNLTVALDEECRHRLTITLPLADGGELASDVLRLPPGVSRNIPDGSRDALEDFVTFVQDLLDKTTEHERAPRAEEEELWDDEDNELDDGPRPSSFWRSKPSIGARPPRSLNFR